MNKNKKKILVGLVILSLFTAVIIINIIALKNAPVILFFDDASFDSFQTYKVESFTLNQKETIRMNWNY